MKTNSASKVRCYLAGPFLPYGGEADWRDYLKKRAGDAIDFYDPRIQTKQGSIATFVSQDLAGVESCDAIFCFVTDLGDIGAAIECARADAKDKLVILCIQENVTIVHPFLLGIARRVLTGLDTGTEYLRQLGSCGLADEFRAIYITIASIQK